jgi:F0F1-type ATP synthase membrane subunit b/b'
MVAIMVFILNRTLLKPINQILAEREKQILGRLAEAEKLATESEEKLRKYNETLHDARVDGYKLLEKERTEGLKQREEKVRSARDEMSKGVAAQIAATRQQEESAKRELDTQAASMGDLISAQILRRPAR